MDFVAYHAGYIEDGSGGYEEKWVTRVGYTYVRVCSEFAVLRIAKSEGMIGCSFLIKLQSMWTLF